MSDLQFYQTRAGRTFFEHTLPELVRQLERLNQNIEKLVECIGDEPEAKRDRRRKEPS